MLEYTIPTVYLNGFQLLSKMEDHNVDEMVLALRAIQIGDSKTGIDERLNNVLNLSNDNINSILAVVTSIAELYDNPATNKSTLAQNLAKSYASSNDLDTERRLAQTLQKVIDNSNILRLGMKARNLMSDHQQVFLDNKILTDIRIVFNDSMEDLHQSAVIIHQLRIDFRNGNETKQSFFALDSADLTQLKISIERAIEKEKNIRSKMYLDNLKFLELSA